MDIDSNGNVDRWTGPENAVSESGSFNVSSDGRINGTLYLERSSTGEGDVSETIECQGEFKDIDTVELDLLIRYNSETDSGAYSGTLYLDRN